MFLGFFSQPPRRGWRQSKKGKTKRFIERGSEYILAHTGPRELDGHPLAGCGSGFGLVPGYTTLSVRVQANIQFGALKIKSMRTKNELVPNPK